MTALFSATDLAPTGGHPPIGHRLDRLELFNWGTFHDRVWSFTPGGATALLTGDIGSGKSTVVDAVTALLVAPHRITFNRAAGAESRERDLRSYVLGHHTSEPDESTGTARPVGLRRGPTWSVLLATFTNEGYATATTIAQVLWVPQGHAGQPERFYVTAERAMSVIEDFAAFGGDPNALRRRLRESGAVVEDTFAAYARRCRRLLGIESEQAMELFAQTVSMKSVADLNAFVRSHMLEPFDAARHTDALVGHVEALTRAHEAVVRSRRQLEELAPLLALADDHDAEEEQVRALGAQRSGLAPFVAARTLTLLLGLVDAAGLALEDLDADERAASAERDAAEVERRGLQRELDGHGGARIGEIEALVPVLRATLAARRSRSDQMADHLHAAGLAPVEDPDAFRHRTREAAEALDRVDDEQDAAREQRDALAVERSDLDGRERALNAELRSLRARSSNIPSRMTELRDRVARGTGLSEADLPFVGELVQVSAAHPAWEGAAERVLHGLGLSMLVPQHHHEAVVAWIDAHHLGGRLVHYPVAVQPGTTGSDDEPVEVPRGGRSTSPLSDVVQVRPGPFAAWVAGEVSRRGDLERVDDVAALRRASRAVTRAGQVKGGGGRHEKDDRSRVDDRSTYVLGWSTTAKTDALLAAAHAMGEERHRLQRRLEDLERAGSTALDRRRALDRVTSVDSFDEVDWRSTASEIAALKDERRRLEESSTEITRLIAAVAGAEGRGRAAGARRDDVREQTTRVRGERERHVERSQQLAELAGLPLLPAVDEELARSVRTSEPVDVAGWEVFERSERERLTTARDRAADRSSTIASSLVRAMKGFRSGHPAATAEMDDDVASAAEYRALRSRLVRDDLPRFEADFKTQLNTNTIREVAGFYAALRRQRELIGERVDTINDSLAGIDYNPGRYIRLETSATPNREVRDFMADLRACTDDALGGDDAYSEARFHQVQALVERFRGRDGSTDVDRQWTRRVTDVRNWVVFAAVERWRADDSAHETYTGSDGKSGGQKEKLAYTILAASLAYQFKLRWGAERSQSFHVALVDEAFGRGSDESTRFALSLFERLGLQLVIVTPLQKISVIERYVESVGFVDNPTGAASRLTNLTITAYREGRARHHADPPGPDPETG